MFGSIPLSQLTTGVGDPETLQVSLMVCPTFVVTSDSSTSNTGGPFNRHKHNDSNQRKYMNSIYLYLHLKDDPPHVKIDIIT